MESIIVLCGELSGTPMRAPNFEYLYVLIKIETMQFYDKTFITVLLDFAFIFIRGLL